MSSRTIFVSPRGASFIQVGRFSCRRCFTVHPPLQNRLLGTRGSLNHVHLYILTSPGEFPDPNIRRYTALMTRRPPETPRGLCGTWRIRSHARGCPAAAQLALSAGTVAPGNSQNGMWHGSKPRKGGCCGALPHLGLGPKTFCLGFY